MIPLKKRGDVAGRDAVEPRRQFGRVRPHLGGEPLGGPGEEPAVPQRARRHQVERSGGVGLFLEALHPRGVGVERRPGTM